MIWKRARSDAIGAGPRTRRGIQIGPRIRVGGTLGKIGQDIKIGTGKVLSNPIVEGGLGFINPALGAAAGGLGRALDTSGGSVGIGDIVKGAGIGGLAGMAGAGLKTGISGLLGGKGIDLGAILKGSGAPGVLQALGLAGPTGTGLGGSGIDIGNLANYGLGGAALVNAAKLQGQSSKYATDALDQAKQAYGEREGLRTAGRNTMLNPSAGINLGGLSQIAQRGNPFARGAAPPQVGGVQIGNMGAA